MQVTASFLGGFAVAFVKGWLLTLVLLTSIIFVVISAWVMFLISFKMASQAQRAYSDAANLVQQTVGSIRTVSYYADVETMASAHQFSLLTSHLHVVLCSGCIIYRGEASCG